MYKIDLLSVLLLNYNFLCIYLVLYSFLNMLFLPMWLFSEFNWTKATLCVIENYIVFKNRQHLLISSWLLAVLHKHWVELSFVGLIWFIFVFVSLLKVNHAISTCSTVIASVQVFRWQHRCISSQGISMSAEHIHFPFCFS